MSTLSVDLLSRSTPEAQGVRSGAILAFLNALEAARFNMHSLMFLRHGQLIAEGWWAPYAAGHTRYIYSLTKSFTSTAVGFAVTEGLLSVEDQVISFFPNDMPQVVSENLAAMRVKDLLTMTTGHGVDTTIAMIMPGVDNWVQSILSLPVDYRPGTHFLYNSGASYLLSAIVQKVTGQKLQDYLTPRLFVPLGITDLSWEVCPRGINTGGWGLSLTTEAIARFGLLYLQKGMWNGSRLLPETWIEEATSFRVRNDADDRLNEPMEWRQGYGYQFWRCQHNAYRGDGAAGQYCVVMPDQDAVLAMTSETQDMQGILDLAWQHLLPAFRDKPIAEDADAQVELRKKLSSLEVTQLAYKPDSATAARVSGRHYTLEPNELGIQSIALSFEREKCCFYLRDGQEVRNIICGYQAWIKSETMLPFMVPTLMSLIFNQKVNHPLKVAARGGWRDEHTFVITMQYLETAHSETITFQFGGDEIVMEISRTVAEADNPFLTARESRFTGKLS